MALRAAHGEAETYSAQRGGSIQHLFVAELLGIGAAFAIGERVAVEAGGYQHVQGTIQEQVAGDLFHGEFVEWQIAIESFDEAHWR